MTVLDKAGKSGQFGEMNTYFLDKNTLTQLSIPIHLHKCVCKSNRERERERVREKESMQSSSHFYYNYYEIISLLPVDIN